MNERWIKDPALTDRDYLNDAKCENTIGMPPKFNSGFLIECNQFP